MNDSADLCQRHLDPIAATLPYDAPCGFLVIDLNERALYANRTLGRWLKREPSEIAGQVRISSILTRESHLYYETQIAPMIQVQGFAREISCKLQVQDRADPLPVLMNAVLRKADGDWPARIDFVFFDATERIQFEQQLRAARNEAEELAAIVRSASVGILRCDEHGRIKRLNEAAVSILHVETDSLPVEPIDSLLILDIDNADWFRHAVQTIGGPENDFRFEACRGETYYNISVAKIAGQQGPFAASDYSVILRDVTRRVVSEQRQQLLVSELHHRIGNIFSVIIGLVRQSIRKSSGDRDKLIDRLQGIYASHKILTENHWKDASIRQILQPIQAQAGDRQKILISGPDIRLAPSHFKALSMAFHELMTNARKYGALSASDGVIRIEWSLGGATGDVFELVWCEFGGPEVSIPDKTGFGTAMIERLLASEFGGQAEVAYRPEGLMFILRGSIGSA